MQCISQLVSMLYSVVGQWESRAVYLQHRTWSVRGCGVVGHLLHLILGTVRVFPKDYMFIARARGQGNKTVT